MTQIILPAGVDPTNPAAVRLSDGTSVYDVPTRSQLPVALAANGGLKVEGVAGGVVVPVSGTFWQATQPVSNASLPLPTGAAQEHATAASPHSARLTDGTTYLGSTAQRLHVDDGGSSLSVDDNAGSLTVDGTFWQATQPVSGPVTDTQLRATPVAVEQATSVDVLGPVTDAQLRATAVPVEQATPVDAVLLAGAAAIGRVGLEPQTSGGLSTFHLVSAASTNATNVKSSAGQLYGYYIYNSNAAARKVAFHNTAGAPTAGASVFFSIVIPPLSAANVEFTNGVAFSAGIGITTVTGLADADAAGVAAGDLVINLFYR